jgi:hypothetical protein
VAQRKTLLATLTPEQREERALRFPQDSAAKRDAPPPSKARLAAEAAADAKSAEFRPTPNVKAILATLWFIADPLWLDLVVSCLKFGVDIGVDDVGPDAASPPDHPPRNMFDEADPAQLKEVLASMDKEIRRGNATDFSSEPLFAWQRLIAAGIVPKKDSVVWRFIKDYSEGKSPDSANALAAKILTSWCSFETVFTRFRKTSKPGARASSWDCTSAYPVFKILAFHRHLTTSFISSRGYSHRLRGDMGLARCGFAWEILGGRLLSTLYAALSPFTSVSTAGTVSVDLRSLTNAFRGVPALSARHPPSPAGFGAVSDREIMITAEARAILAVCAASASRAPGAVDLSQVSRWCDDFVSFASSPTLAANNDCAVVFFHKLFGFALAQDKFFPARAHQEFYGVTFNVDSGVVSLSDTKIEKMISVLASFRQGRRSSLKDLRRLAGLLNFFGCVYPAMRIFSSSALAAVSLASRLSATKRGPSPSTPALVVNAELAGDLTAWARFLATAPRSVSSMLLPADEAARNPDVVAHTDWSGSPEQGVLAGVLLEPDARKASHYAFGPMPGEFYEPRTEGQAKDVHSSPVGEATAILALLSTFSTVVKGKVLLCYSDNLPLVQRFYNPKKSASHSIALHHRLQDIAFLASTLNTRLVLIHVPSKACVADCLTRDSSIQTRVEKLEAKLASLSLSTKLSRRHLSLPPTQSLPERPRLA